MKIGKINSNYFWVCSYLVAIIAANLSIYYFGAEAAVVNAFVFIAFDLTVRDKLHDAWQNKNLWIKMLLLIATGSLLSWVLNTNTGPFAVASFLAFAGAGFSDTLIYQLLGDKSRLVKMNGSNVVSSIADSTIFVLVAGLPLAIIPAQIVAKIVGGFVWSLLLSKFNNS